MTTTENIILATDDLTSWPLRPCGRCGGSGTYSFTPKWGTTCFQCGFKPHVPGLGKTTATKAAGEIRGQYQKDVRSARETIGSKLEVGDNVWVRAEDGRISDRKTRGGSWVEVVGIEETDRPSGKMKIGGDENTPWMVTSWDSIVTLADGTVHTVGGQSCVRRRFDADPTPYIEEAWTTVPKKLQTARKVFLAMTGGLR